MNINGIIYEGESVALLLQHLFHISIGDGRFKRTFYYGAKLLVEDHL